MGKTTQRAVQEIRGFKGQNSGLSPDAVGAEYAERTKNLIPLRNTLKKVDGTSQYCLLSGSGRINMLEFYRELWMVQRGTSLLKEDNAGAASFTGIHTLSSSERLSATKWKDAIYFANGRDLLAYNFDIGAGTTVKQLGMYPPLGTVDNANVSLAAGGGLENGKVYRWVITYFDPDTNTESPAINARPASNGLCILDPYSDSDLAPDYWEKTASAGGQKAVFAFAALNSIFTATGDQARDSRQTHFKVYRTTGNGTIFRQVGSPTSIASFITAAVDYEDTIADTSLGVVLQTSGASPPPRLERIREALDGFLGVPFVDATVRSYVHMREFKDSLFGFGAYGPGLASATEENAFRPYKSVLYIHDAFIPDYVFTTRDVADGDGQLPTGIAVLRDNTVILLKERSAHYLSGSNIRNYEVRPLDATRGCVSRHSIQETPYGVICLDRSGVVLFDGIGPAKTISEPFMEDEIRNINFAAIETCYSFYDSDESLYYLAIPVDGSTKPNRTLVYNAKDQAWTYLEGQEGYSANVGYRTTGSAGTQAGDKVVLRGDSVNQDKLLDWSSEQNVLNVSQVIEAEYLSPILYCGDPSVRKKTRFVYILAETSTDFTLDIGILPDFGQRNGEVTLENINSASSYAVYAASLLDSGVNVGVFDESIWSGQKVKKMIKVPISSVGFGFQIRIKHRSSDPDEYGFRLLSVKLETSEMGK